MSALITDEQQFDGACSRFGNPYRTYDDGFGPLWVYRESLGVLGIVRAQTWEDAYEICEDAIMDDADPQDISSYARDYDPTAEPWELAEGVHYRPNGPPNVHGLTSFLCAEDLNGSILEPLTPELLAEFEITLHISDC